MLPGTSDGFRSVLADLVPTYDADGGVLGISAVTDLQEPAVSTADTDTDFAFAPEDHEVSDGLIGDTIFLDVNPSDGNDYVPGVDQPLEGVTVNLYDEDGAILLATTTTDENGNYTFGGLDPVATYTVAVDTSTLPNTGTGLKYAHAWANRTM